MNKNGIHSKIIQKFKEITNFKLSFPTAPNLLNMEFEPEKINTDWPRILQIFHQMRVGHIYAQLLIFHREKWLDGHWLKIWWRISHNRFCRAWNNQKPAADHIFQSVRCFQYTSEKVHFLLITQLNAGHE